MIENFDYEKGQEFLNKTNQPLHILKGVNNINPIDYKQLLTNLTVKDDEYGLMSFIGYHDEEQLYCRLIKNSNYNVPFTFIELRCAIKLVNMLQHTTKKKTVVNKLKKAGAYNQQAIDYAYWLKNALINWGFHPRGAKSLGLSVL